MSIKNTWTYLSPKNNTGVTLSFRLGYKLLENLVSAINQALAIDVVISESVEFMPFFSQNIRFQY